MLQYGLGIQFVSYLIVAAIFIVGKMNIAVLIAFEMLSTTGKIIFNSGSIGILPHLVSENDIHDGINITQRINSVMSILGGARWFDGHIFRSGKFLLISFSLFARGVSSLYVDTLFSTK